MSYPCLILLFSIVGLSLSCAPGATSRTKGAALPEPWMPKKDAVATFDAKFVEDGVTTKLKLVHEFRVTGDSVLQTESSVNAEGKMELRRTRVFDKAGREWRLRKNAQQPELAAKLGCKEHLHEAGFVAVPAELAKGQSLPKQKLTLCALEATVTGKVVKTMRCTPLGSTEVDCAVIERKYELRGRAPLDEKLRALTSGHRSETLTYARGLGMVRQTASGKFTFAGEGSSPGTVLTFSEALTLESHSGAEGRLAKRPKAP